MLQAIINLVLQLVVVKVVLVLVPTPFPTINIIWFDGDYFVSYRSRYYPAMIHSNKYRNSYSLYQSWKDRFSVSGDGRGGVGTSTNHFSSHKFGFEIYRHDMGLRLYQSHCT